MTTHPLSPLNHARAIEILQALDRHPLKVTDLGAAVGGSHSTVQTRLEELEAHGLLETNRDGDGFTSARVATLTPKGEAVLPLVDDLQEVLR